MPLRGAKQLINTRSRFICTETPGVRPPLGSDGVLGAQRQPSNPSEITYSMLINGEARFWNLDTELQSRELPTLVLGLEKYLICVLKETKAM